MRFGERVWRNVAQCTFLLVENNLENFGQANLYSSGSLLLIQVDILSANKLRKNGGPDGECADCRWLNHDHGLALGNVSFIYGISRQGKRSEKPLGRGSLVLLDDGNTTHIATKMTENKESWPRKSVIQFRPRNGNRVGGIGFTCVNSTLVNQATLLLSSWRTGAKYALLPIPASVVVTVVVAAPVRAPAAGPAVVVLVVVVRLENWRSK